ncbi:MAG: transposase [Bacilli bacterium]
MPNHFSRNWDINNFDKPSKLIAFAGTDPTESQSGNKLSANDKTFKRGSPYLRHAIYKVSLVAISNEPELRTYHFVNTFVSIYLS